MTPRLWIVVFPHAIPFTAGPVKKNAVEYQDILPDLERTLSGPWVYRTWTTDLLQSSVAKCTTNTHINLVTTLTLRRSLEDRWPWVVNTMNATNFDETCQNKKKMATPARRLKLWRDQMSAGRKECYSSRTCCVMLRAVWVATDTVGMNCA